MNNDWWEQLWRVIFCIWCVRLLQLSSCSRFVQEKFENSELCFCRPWMPRQLLWPHLALGLRQRAYSHSPTRCLWVALSSPRCARSPKGGKCPTGAWLIVTLFGLVSLDFLIPWCWEWRFWCVDVSLVEKRVRSWYVHEWWWWRRCQFRARAEAWAQIGVAFWWPKE